MSLGRLTAALADRYRIDRELGAGGMATVYLADDLKHDRKVAIRIARETADALQYAHDHGIIHRDIKPENLRLAPPAAWFWPAGILDPATGRIELIPTEKELDVADPQWDATGRIVALTEALSATLWRYRPVHAKGGPP